MKGDGNTCISLNCNPDFWKRCDGKIGMVPLADRRKAFCHWLHTSSKTSIFYQRHQPVCFIKCTLFFLVCQEFKKKNGYMTVLRKEEVLCTRNLFMKISLLFYCILHYVFNVIKKKNQKKSKKSEVKKKNEKWDVGVGVKWMGRVGKKNEKIFTFFHFNFFFKFVNISWQDDFFFFSFFFSYSISVFFLCFYFLSFS